MVDTRLDHREDEAPLPYTPFFPATSTCSSSRNQVSDLIFLISGLCTLQALSIFFLGWHFSLPSFGFLLL